MKVIVTLDYWDGTRSLQRQCELEAVTRMMVLWLSEKGVAGVTVTRCDGLLKAAQESRKKEFDR